MVRRFLPSEQLAIRRLELQFEAENKRIKKKEDVLIDKRRAQDKRISKRINVLTDKRVSLVGKFRRKVSKVGRRK